MNCFRLAVGALMATWLAPLGLHAAPAKPANANAKPSGKEVKVSDSATPVELLTAVQKRYDSFSDFSAEFEQTLVRASRPGKGRSESGKVYLKRPGLMRWDYSAPATKNFIVDGERLWAYKPDEATVAVYDNFKEAEISAGLSFLWSKKSLASSFEPKQFTGPDPLGEPVSARAVRLLPKAEDPSIKTLTFYLDEKAFIEKAIIEDHLGNINIFKFKGMATDTQLKKDAFLFTPPAGVKVVHVD